MEIIPDKRKLVGLVEQAYEGKICLPDFQRDFVWPPDYIADLIRSVLRRYFVGSLLLLRCDRDRPPFSPTLLRGETGRGAYWVLAAKLAQRLRPGSRDEAQRRIDWEGAKTRVLSILKQRAERGEGGITNKEIRAITHYDRNQSYRLMKELRRENLRIKSESHGKGARYVWE